MNIKTHAKLPLIYSALRFTCLKNSKRVSPRRPRITQRCKSKVLNRIIGYEWAACNARQVYM